jgi:hypothetical protein
VAEVESMAEIFPESSILDRRILRQVNEPWIIQILHYLPLTGIAQMKYAIFINFVD